MYIVSKRVLLWEIEVLTKPDILEDVTITVELVKGFLGSWKRSGVMKIMAYKIAEVEESGNTSNHLNQDEPLNSW